MKTNRTTTALVVTAALLTTPFVVALVKLAAYLHTLAQ